MTLQEKATVIDRASKLFQEWCEYLRESGTKFNPCPRQDIEDMFKDWNDEFMKAMDEELDDITTVE